MPDARVRAMESWFPMATSKSGPVSFSTTPVTQANPFLPGREANLFAKPFEMHNPFAQVSATDVAADAPEGSYTYQLVQNGPAPLAEEVETPARAVEIVIRWGATTLHVAHLTPPRPFFVGESTDKAHACDFSLPAERIGETRMPLLVTGEGGQVRLVVPANATGTITFAGQAAKSVREMFATAVPCASLANAVEIPMPEGAKAELEIGGINFSISTVNAGRAVGGRFRLDSRGLPYQALSLMLHAGLLAATAVFMPSMAMADQESMSDQQTYELKAMIDAAAEREPEQKKDESTAANAGPSGGTGSEAKGESGKMGSATSRATNGRYGLAGPKDNPDVQPSRAQALADASSFGMIGLLNSGLGGDPNAVTVAWGGDVTSGRDPKNALGNMWGQSIDEAGGAGGLGLSGIGDGGGGQWNGIGLGRVGTVGNGNGLGDGQDFGNGHSHGQLQGTHIAKAPGLVRVGTPITSGRLPPEIIQRTVRQNFGRFKFCYEAGLRNNPNLAGRVAVRFIINHDGSVSSAQNGGSDLPDAGVVSCVTRAFFGLSFPQPENGIVTVTYPIVFAPAN
ncbi:MAG: AgmX/PglI C-terminal domain-containing protein [Byssovorax sp.]